MADKTEEQDLMEPLSAITFATRTSESDAFRPLRSSGDRALAQALSNAALRLNDVGYPGAGREITFSLDPATRLPLIEIVDQETREVLSQWPSAYLLELAAEQSKR
jgi:uncharacterized FlaG/YvyC family protein